MPIPPPAPPVKRYSMLLGSELGESPHGPWVKWSDVEAVVAWHRDMALRFAIDRDEQKHLARKLQEEISQPKGDRFMLNAYGRQCWEAGYAAAKAEVEALLLQRAQAIAELQAAIEALIRRLDAEIERCDQAEALLTARAPAIAQGQAERDWQPIETMPRDGRDVLVLHPGGEVCISYWGSIRGVEGIKSKLHRSANGGEGDFCRDATHWMRLPSADAARVARAPQPEQEKFCDGCITAEWCSRHRGCLAEARPPIAAPRPASAALRDWQSAALLKDRTRRAIRERATAGDSHADLAADYGVPLAFVEALCAWQFSADDARAEQPEQEP